MRPFLPNRQRNNNVLVNIAVPVPDQQLAATSTSTSPDVRRVVQSPPARTLAGETARGRQPPRAEPLPEGGQCAVVARLANTDTPALRDSNATPSHFPPSSYALFLLILYTTTFAFVYEQINPGTTAQCHHALIQHLFNLSLTFKTLFSISIASARSLLNMSLTFHTVLVSVIAFSGQTLERGIIVTSHTIGAGVLSLVSCVMRLGVGCVDAIVFRARVFKAITDKAVLVAMSSETVRQLLIFVGGVILGRVYERFKIRRTLEPVPVSVRAECDATGTGTRTRTRGGEDSVTLMQDDNDNDNDHDGEGEGEGETGGGKPFQLRAVLSIIDFARLLTRPGDNEGARVGSPEPPSLTANRGRRVSDVVVVVGPADRSTSEPLVVPIEFGITSPSVHSRIEGGISPQPPPSSAPVSDSENETGLGEGRELVELDVVGALGSPMPGSFMHLQETISPRQPPSSEFEDEVDGNDVSEPRDDPMAELLMLIEETGFLSQRLPPTSLLRPVVPVQGAVPPPGVTNHEEDGDPLGVLKDSPVSDYCDVIVSLSRLSFQTSKDGDGDDGNGSGLPDSPILDPRVDTAPLRRDSQPSSSLVADTCGYFHEHEGGVVSRSFASVGNGGDDHDVVVPTREMLEPVGNVISPPQPSSSARLDESVGASFAGVDDDGRGVGGLQDGILRPNSLSPSGLSDSPENFIPLSLPSQHPSSSSADTSTATNANAGISSLATTPAPADLSPLESESRVSDLNDALPVVEPSRQSHERPEVERERTRQRRAEVTRELGAWRKVMLRVIQVALKERTRRAGQIDGAEVEEEEEVGGGGGGDEVGEEGDGDGHLAPSQRGLLDASVLACTPVPIEPSPPRDRDTPAPASVHAQQEALAPATATAPTELLIPPSLVGVWAPAQSTGPIPIVSPRRPKRRRRHPKPDDAAAAARKEKKRTWRNLKRQERKRRCREMGWLFGTSGVVQGGEAKGKGKAEAEDVGDVSMLEVQEHLIGANTSVVANLAHGLEAEGCDIEAVESADDASMLEVQGHLLGMSTPVPANPSNDPYWRTGRSNEYMSFVTNPSDEGGERFECAILGDWDGGSAVEDEMEPLLEAGPSVIDDPSNGRYWRMRTADGGRAFVADPVYKSGFGYPVLSDCGGSYVGQEPPLAESTPVVNDALDDASWWTERAEGGTSRGDGLGIGHHVLGDRKGGNAGRPLESSQKAHLQAPIPASVPVEHSPAPNAPTQPPVPPTTVNQSNGRRRRRRRRPTLEHALAAAWKDKKRTRQSNRRQERSRKYTRWATGVESDVVVESASEEGVVLGVGSVRGGLGSGVVSEAETDDVSVFGTEVAMSVSSAVTEMSDDEDLASQSGASTSFLPDTSVEYGGEDTPPIRADRYLGRGARFAARYALEGADDGDEVEGGAGGLRADWRSRALTELWVTEHAWRV